MEKLDVELVIVTQTEHVQYLAGPHFPWIFQPAAVPRTVQIPITTMATVSNRAMAQLLSRSSTSSRYMRRTTAAAYSATSSRARPLSLLLIQSYP